MHHFIKHEEDYYPPGFAHFGGGGNSGTVRFAPYLEYFHQGMIATDDVSVKDLQAIMSTKHAANPYSAYTFTDPSSIFSDTETQFGALKTLVDGIDPDTDWGTFIDTINTKLGTVLTDVDIADIFTDSRTSFDLTVEQAVQSAVHAINDVVIRGQVKAFDRRNADKRRAAINRLSGTMSDINAVNGSAYLFGVAIIESQHIQDVAEFDAGLTTELYKTAFTESMRAYSDEVKVRLNAAIANKQNFDQILLQSAGLMTEFTLKHAELTNSISRLKTEVNRIKYVGTQEYELTDLDLQEKDADWDMQVMMQGGQFLGMIGGGQAIPNKPSRASSAIGGALGGAGAGAGIGTALGGPGIGTAVGALLGLGAGLLT